jgi:hypothetical protein
MMKDDQPIESYHYQNYQVLVREEADIFILAIPELGLIVRHKCIDEAYKELKAAKELHLKNIVDAGFGSLIPEASTPSSANFKPSVLKNIASQMGLFIIKALIVLLLFVGMGSIALVTLGNITSKNLGRLSNKIESYQPLEKAVSKIESLPDEKVEEIRNQLRRINKKLMPLVRELKTTFESEKLK